MQSFRAARMVVVERNRSFVAIGCEILGGFVAHKWRTPLAGLVAGSWPLHLDDVRAKITEQHGAVWPGKRLRHFDDTNRIENGFHGPRL